MNEGPMVNFNALKKPYLIAEIGINHNADMQIAKRLIDASFACQWHCVKFQKRDPDICVPEAQKNVMRKTPWGEMTYLEYRKKLEFGKKEFAYIDSYCKEKPITWTASVWDIPSLAFIEKFNVPFIKIPSAKLTDFDLLRESCSFKKPVILSTGMSSLQEIDKAVAILEKKAPQFVLMHTNSAYPAPFEELNVRCIQTLKKRYRCTVGYSGHEYDVEPTVYAVVLGAMVIERHITLSHTLWGTDQASSLEVMGMDILRKRIENADVALGDGKKTITPSEIPIRKKLRGN